MFQRLFIKSICHFPELTSTDAGSFGGSSFVTKVRDMFVKAFVRMGEGGAGGAVYVSFWTTLVRGTVLDRENLLPLSPVYRKKEKSIFKSCRLQKSSLFSSTNNRRVLLTCTKNCMSFPVSKPLQCWRLPALRQKSTKVSGHKHKKILLSQKSTSLTNKDFLVSYSS